jgi:hypothetical protein
MTKKLKYSTVDKILWEKYPMGSRRYHDAHRDANREEKKEYPKGYQQMKKVDDELPDDEYSGTHNRKGKIEVSKKVPPKDREEVALHEFVEWKHDPKRCKICGKDKQSHKN